MQNEIPIAGFLELLKMFFGRRFGVSVEGDSMLPTLKTGDRVLVDPRASVETGDIVLAIHPFKKSVRVIKRLLSVEPDGRVFLGGDNVRSSSDSRVLGTILRENVIGKVVARIG